QSVEVLTAGIAGSRRRTVRVRPAGRRELPLAGPRALLPQRRLTELPSPTLRSRRIARFSRVQDAASGGHEAGAGGTTGTRAATVGVARTGTRRIGAHPRAGRRQGHDGARVDDTVGERRPGRYRGR